MGAVAADEQDDLKVLYARVINIEAISNGPVGAPQGAYANGATGAFTLAGEQTGFSGLTAGTHYYTNGDGTLATANTGHYAGFAKDATTLVVGALQ